MHTFAGDDACFAVRAYREQRDRTPPDAAYIFQHALGAFDVDAATIALVIVQQLQAAIDMQMVDRDARRTIVELGRENRFPHRMLAILGNADVAVLARLINE